MPDNNVPVPSNPPPKKKLSDKPWPPIEKSRNFFALIVGIDDYPGKAELEGCIKDVENVETYLKTVIHEQVRLANEELRASSEESQSASNDAEETNEEEQVSSEDTDDTNEDQQSTSDDSEEEEAEEEAELVPGVPIQSLDELYICTLKDEQATYENIIAGFRRFLCAAKGDDIVWFHFSGHGTQEPTAEEFEAEESDDLNQAMVCFYKDENQADPFLLADKELAKLINEVATRKVLTIKAADDSEAEDSNLEEPIHGKLDLEKGIPHIVVTQDCCHSGSGTRSANEPAPRAFSFEGLTPRKLKDYLMVNKKGTFGESAIIHMDRRVNISACKSTEKAIDTSNGGLFTNAMLKALEESGGAISYADLTTQIDLLMKQEKAQSQFLSSLATTEQTPQIDALDHFNVWAKFLDPTTIVGRADEYDVYFDGIDWKIKCGAIYGLPEDGSTTIPVSIRLANEIVATTKIKEVSAFESILENFEQATTEADADIPKETKYKGRLVNRPGKAISFFIAEAEEEKTGTHNLIAKREEIIREKEEEQESSNLKNIILVTEKTDDVLYQINAENGHYTIQSLVNNSQVRYDTESRQIGESDYDADRTKTTLTAMERIAHWQQFHDLDRKDSFIKTMVEEATLTVKTTAETPLEFANGEVQLHLSDDQFEERTVRLNNKAVKVYLLKYGCIVRFNTSLSQENLVDLHFYFLHFNSDYGVKNWIHKVDHFEANQQEKEDLDLLKGVRRSTLGIPEDQGVDRWRFKLLVTTQAIEVEHLEQKGLDGTKAILFDDLETKIEDWCVFDFDVDVKRVDGPG